MYWRCLVGLVFLFCGSQVFGDKRAEQDLLKAAIQEMEEEESSITERESKRELAEKFRHQVKEAKSAKSPPKQKYDFGDVVVTVSEERELEEAPEAYLQKTDRATVLNIKKKSQRQTSSVKSREQSQREPSSKRTEEAKSIQAQEPSQREPSSSKQ